MNYFDHLTAAERYAQGRPFFQPLVAERVRRVCYPHQRAVCAIDVGCGTGQSTVAMVEVAERVIGIDVSVAMLRHAKEHLRVSYVAGAAEALPFRSQAIDLITVGLALHWFDRNEFLAEARRVLRPGGWLVVFNDRFSGTMNENRDYADWSSDSYGRRFPTPPRNAALLDDDEARNHGFAVTAHERFSHTVAFTPDELVRYLLTHSNVIAAAEQGTEDIGSITAWLSDEVRPLFKDQSGTFPFHCDVDIYQRQPDDPRH
ncbi:class I SAM-dependent methyltransferase [Bauldia sp.]|uniref:class I SAM-dependent methyltransferase n=1 Tax=Bauldia sp. TaxID=2575872 RepID=UPI003BAA13EE